MSLSCFTDYIGTDSCNTPNALSGLFINELPGVELNMLDKLSTEQQANFEGLWADVQKRALRRLESDVRAEFAKRYRIKTLTQSMDLGRDIDTSTTTAAADEYRGVILELNNETDKFVDSTFQSIYVETVDFYSDYAGSVDVKIFDLDLGTTLKTVTVTAVSGWNTANVYDIFVNRRIFVAYDSNNITSVKQDLTDIRNATLDRDYNCLCADFNDARAKLNGAKAATGTPTTITTGLDSFGLSLKFGVTCSFDAFVCRNKKIFENSLWFLLGIELMKERKYTSRLNEFTAFGQDRASELEMLFEAQYKGGVVKNEFGAVEYPGELKQAIDGIMLDQDDLCLECNAPIRSMDAKL